MSVRGRLDKAFNLNKNLYQQIEKLSADKTSTFIIHCHHNFGDVLHSSVIVNHYRKLNPTSEIIWTISDSYVKAFEPTAAFLNVKLFALPARFRFRNEGLFVDGLRTQGYKAVIVSSLLFQHNKELSVIDNHLTTAGIGTNLANKRPIFAVSEEDKKFAHDFLIKNPILKNGFIALEYESLSIEKMWAVNKYAELVDKLKFPVLYLSGENGKFINSPNAIDGRGLSFGVSKALIKMSKLFVGCSSGLSCLTSCRDMNKKMLLLNTPEWAKVDKKTLDLTYLYGDVESIVKTINEII